MTVVNDTIKKMMELVDGYNNGNSNNARMEINWDYWIANAVLFELTSDYMYGQGWTVHRIISRDGLVLEVYSNENGVFIRVDSVHGSTCTCGE
ncbi:MAG: hypothetical protein QW794_04500 [Thermosphaera sp.]